MYMKSCAALALATGFAAATPIIAPHAPVDLPIYPRGAPVTPWRRGLNQNLGAFGVSNNFDFSQQVDVFQEQINTFSFQQQSVNEVLFEQNNNLQFEQEQFVFAASQQVVQIEQFNNGGNLFFKDLSRKASFRNQFSGISTVIMVVKEINIQMDDGQGNFVSANAFAQSILIANAGQRETQQVMVLDETKIEAASVFNAFGGFQGVGGSIAAPTGVAQGFPQGVAAQGTTGGAAPTRTNDVQFFGVQPTWSQIVADPAATAAPAWQAELLDLNNNGNAQQLAQLNAQFAGQQKSLLGDSVQGLSS